MVLLYPTFLKFNETAVHWSKASYTSHYRVDDIATSSWETHHQIGYDSNILDGFTQLPQKNQFLLLLIFKTVEFSFFLLIRHRRSSSRILHLLSSGCLLFPRTELSSQTSFIVVHLLGTFFQNTGFTEDTLEYILPRVLKGISLALRKGLKTYQLIVYSSVAFHILLRKSIAVWIACYLEKHILNREKFEYTMLSRPAERDKFVPLPCYSYLQQGTSTPNTPSPCVCSKRSPCFPLWKSHCLNTSTGYWSFQRTINPLTKLLARK